MSGRTNNQRSPHYVNPYAEQNARVVGYRFREDTVHNRPLPGIPSAEGKFYIPLDMIPRRPYRDDDDGWTKVVNKRSRRYRRNGGWVGSDSSVAASTGAATSGY
jgi:hypothetical protein